jgi:hypothetical protein
VRWADVRSGALNGAEIARDVADHVMTVFYHTGEGARSRRTGNEEYGPLAGL